MKKLQDIENKLESEANLISEAIQDIILIVQDLICYLQSYVLEDGTRVLSGRGMQDALNMVEDFEDSKQKSGARLSRYLDQKTLQPYIYKGKDVGHYKAVSSSFVSLYDNFTRYPKNSLI